MIPRCLPLAPPAPNCAEAGAFAVDITGTRRGSLALGGIKRLFGVVFGFFIGIKV
jgi:hypothetical protein